MGCVNHQNMGGLLWLYEHYILPEMDEMFTPFLSFSIQYNQTPNITLANMRTETLRFGVLWVQQRVRCRVWICCPSTVSLGDLFFLQKTKVEHLNASLELLWLRMTVCIHQTTFHWSQPGCVIPLRHHFLLWRRLGEDVGYLNVPKWSIPHHVSHGYDSISLKF